jgi:hypothetical protein
MTAIYLLNGLGLGGKVSLKQRHFTSCLQRSLYDIHLHVIFFNVNVSIVTRASCF